MIITQIFPSIEIDTQLENRFIYQVTFRTRMENNILHQRHHQPNHRVQFGRQTQV